MAILTPTRPPRRDARARAVSRISALTDTVSDWLAHPLASLVLLVVPAFLLLALGTIMVLSASSVFAYTRYGNAYYFVTRQAFFLVGGLIAAVILARLPTETLRRLGWPIFLLAGVLLALTFTPLGYELNGNRNWLNFGSGSLMPRIQPSEFAKLAIICWGASVLVAKRRLLDQPKHLLVPFLPLSLLLVGLVILQHDLGTAIVLSGVVVAVLWCVGAPLRVLGSMVAIVGTAAAFLVATSPSRLQRIAGFLDPSVDPTGINHQPNQALYGLATGGWLGVGLGAGRQKWGSLSEAHTDYVLAVIGEEMGLLGTLAVMGLFLVLGYAGFRIALRTSTFYARIVAAGITCWFMMQALVNVMVVLKMLPVLGVPLPLVSYGGSALLANLMALGVLVACAREEPETKAWLARLRKKKGSRRRLSAVLPGHRT